MEGLLLLYMTIYGILNGLGVALLKLGLQNDNYKNISFPSRKVKEIISKLYKFFKFILRNKFILLAMTCVLIALIFYQISLKYFSFIDVKTLMNANVIFSIIFGVLICKERFSKWEFLGIIVSSIGILIIGLDSQPSATMTSYSNLFWFIVIDIGLVGIGMGLFYKFRFNAEHFFPFMASLMLVAANLTNKVILQDIDSLTIYLIMIMLQNPLFYLLIICYVFSFLFYMFGIKQEQSRISMVVLLASVFGTLISVFTGYFIFNENPSTFKWIGISCVAVGIIFLPRK